MVFLPQIQILLSDRTPQSPVAERTGPGDSLPEFLCGRRRIKHGQWGICRRSRWLFQYCVGQLLLCCGQQADAAHRGTFVWADSGNTPFASTNVNQFLIRATGGVGIGTNAPAEQLDVNGGIHLGNTANNNAGTIRWTGTDFEGRTNSAWQSLTAGGGGGGDSPWNVTDSALTARSFLGINRDPLLSTLRGDSDQTFVNLGRQSVLGTTGQNFVNATVGGGNLNQATASASTVAGGSTNIASGANAFVGGGSTNTASGQYSMVPGGLSNQAQTPYSFAAGRRAIAQHKGTFVWADSTNANFASGGPNQFLIRAGGGVGIGTTSPAQQLDVNGAIKIGNATANSAGSIRWTGTAFEGNNGTTWSALGGGADSHAGIGANSFIGGGLNNSADLGYATVVGGEADSAQGANSFVGGGYANVAVGYSSAIVGGTSNRAEEAGDFIGAGSGNKIVTGAGGNSSIVGGSNNFVLGTYAFVGGGATDSALAIGSAVVGGGNNIASGNYSALVGGLGNSAIEAL